MGGRGGEVRTPGAGLVSLAGPSVGSITSRPLSRPPPVRFPWFLYRFLRFQVRPTRSALVRGCPRPGLCCITARSRFGKERPAAALLGRRERPASSHLNHHLPAPQDASRRSPALSTAVSNIRQHPTTALGPNNTAPAPLSSRTPSNSPDHLPGTHPAAPTHHSALSCPQRQHARAPALSVIPPPPTRCPGRPSSSISSLGRGVLTTSPRAAAQ